MCNHEWQHFETRYLLIDNYPASNQFKRIDRFFCKKCCETKEIVKSCMDWEDRNPEWFNRKKYEVVRR